MGLAGFLQIPGGMVSWTPPRISSVIPGGIGGILVGIPAGMPPGIPGGIPSISGGIRPGINLGSQVGLAGSRLTFLPGLLAPGSVEEIA